MKILLNAAAATWLGGRTYLENLALALASLPDSERPEVLANAGGPAFDSVATVVDGIPRDVDVLFPNWSAPRGVRAAQVHWIPDLQHRALPENFPLRERLRRDLGYRRLVRSAALVVVSSATAAADVVRAYPGSRTKLRVLHFRTVVPEDAGAAAPTETVRSYGLPDEFIFLPNQFWAHKNHATAFAAANELPLPIVCTGAMDDHRQKGFVEALLHRAPRDRVHLLGVVPRHDYLQLLRAARAVLQPSLFEGWSSIVEDARAFGKPLAVSDIPVHREQAPEHGHFFEPRDPAALAAAVRDALSDSGEKEHDALRVQHDRVVDYARDFVSIVEEAASSR